MSAVKNIVIGLMVIGGAYAIGKVIRESRKGVKRAERSDAL